MDGAKNKIKSWKELAEIIRKLKKRGQKIAFTNGCFDILHRGHVKYLQDARRLADILVVGLNSDSSVRKIKGKQRPLNKENDRAAVLAALACVDYITLFGRQTPLELIRLLKPDVLIKGGDWKEENIVGADFVKGCRGKVAVIPYLKGYSTSGLIEKIKGG